MVYNLFEQLANTQHANISTIVFCSMSLCEETNDILNLLYTKCHAQIGLELDWGLNGLKHLSDLTSYFLAIFNLGVQFHFLFAQIF